MSLAIALIFAFGLFYVLGREHGKRSSDHGRRRVRGRDEDWSPFDDFYSGR